MSVRREIDTAVAEANPIDRETAAGLLPKEVGLRFIEAVAMESVEDRTPPRRPRRQGMIPARRPTLGLGLIVVATCLVLASLTLFTAPGRAVSSWVGEQVGLGDPGGHPTLQQLRHSWDKGTIAEGRPAHVLVVGPTPEGNRYEYITFRPRPRRTKKGKLVPGEGPCFELDLTQARSSYGLGCGILAEGPVISAAGVGSGGMPGHVLWHLAGQASMAVASLEARLDGRPIAVELVPIPAELVDRFHFGRRFRFFIVFMHGDQGGGTLSITARDAGGKVLARRKFEMYGIFRLSR